MLIWRSILPETCFANLVTVGRMRKRLGFFASSNHTPAQRSETSFVRTWGGEFKLVRRRESKRKLSVLLGLLQTEIDKSTDLLAKIGNVLVTETPERRCARSSRVLENRTLRLVSETIDEKRGETPASSTRYQAKTRAVESETRLTRDERKRDPPSS